MIKLIFFWPNGYTLPPKYTTAAIPCRHSSIPRSSLFASRLLYKIHEKAFILYRPSILYPQQVSIHNTTAGKKPDNIYLRTGRATTAGQLIWNRSTGQRLIYFAHTIMHAAGQFVYKINWSEKIESDASIARINSARSPTSPSLPGDNKEVWWPESQEK